jgi:hypothetical protein
MGGWRALMLVGWLVLAVIWITWLVWTCRRDGDDGGPA